MFLLKNRVIVMIILIFSYLSADDRYAFVYSKNIDDRFINFYDKVIVEADAIDNIYAIRYPKKMVAYISVGEIETWRKTKTPYDKSWVISENKIWNSLIGDLRNDDYQKFIFERVASLYKKGYRNFFLDTMDAYHVIRKDKVLFEKQKKALISFVHKLHKRYPKSKIIVNRGFELLDDIHRDIDAVVAESLLSRYNHAKKEYIKVPKADSEWLLTNFQKAQKYGLDTISIDYLNRSTKERLEIAKEIKKLGVIPYVTDGLLQEQGECNIERIRRDILILFNKTRFDNNDAIYSDVHLLTSMPLEYLGYVPVIYDISAKELPKSVEDKYHSVIIWSDGVTKNNEKLYSWVINLKERGVKFLFLNNFVFSPTEDRFKKLNLKEEVNKNKFTADKKVIYHKPYKEYEIPASPEYDNIITKTENGKEVLSVVYKNGQKSTTIAITPWGGYALGNSFLLGIGDENYWTIDPFKFLKDTLRLEDIPVPDPTTESGRRILFVHVDGDGFVERVRTDRDRLSTEYLIEQIYKKYKIPQSVSLIQGEIERLFPKLTPKMEKISRELYSIPWIEPASHTLSHPFIWAKASKPENAKPSIGKKYHLPIPNYHFSIEKETKKSVEFALSFAPKHKQKEKMMFWTGDCTPTKKILAYIEREGILAMNGGDTTISKSYPWLGRIAPFGIQREEYWQIYTGQQNENVYTNEWLGPYWGYREVIETFQMTGEPRRIKPINIYYHLYSGSRISSLKALDEVYAWSVNQKTTKLYASQYIKKARGFYRTAIGKIDGGYEIKNSGYLRTIRFDKKVSVDIVNSKGVAGFNHEGERTYLTLDRDEQYEIRLTEEKKSPYLIDSNGWVENFSHKNKIYRFNLKANMPIEAKFYLPPSCSLSITKEVKRVDKKNIIYISSNKKILNLIFRCQYSNSNLEAIYK